MLKDIPLPLDAQALALRKFKDEHPKEFAKALGKMSNQELEDILFDDSLWLRPNQMFHQYPESIVFFMGGRGTGKGHAGSRWVRKMVEEYGARNIGIIGQTAFDVKNVMIHGPAGILSAFPPKDRPDFSPANRTITFKNGAKAFSFSAQDGDKLRGNNFDALWCDEICTWKDDDAFNQAMLALRSGISKALLTSTPKPSKLIVDLWKRRDDDVRFVHGTTYENFNNLSKAYKEQIVSAFENTRLGAQELDGRLLLDVPGALWTSETLNKCYVDEKDLPEMVSTVIALDPSGSSNASTSDECGISVVGKGIDDIIYVLGDFTAIMSPRTWAEKAIQLFDYYNADKIIYERNYGGDMIETILSQVRKNIPLQDVWAKKGKLLRAEGPSLLYEQQRVKHVKGLTDLEEEMTTYNGKGKSPNRLDALVYGVSSFIEGKTNKITSSEFLL